MFTEVIHLAALSAQHGDDLRAEAARERLAKPWSRRRALATWLRQAADRLDRTPLASTPASQV